MDVLDLRKKTPMELKHIAEDLRRKIRDLRFSVTTRQQTKVRNLRHAKKELAQIETVAREMVK